MRDRRGELAKAVHERHLPSGRNHAIEQRQNGEQLVYSDNELEVCLARTFREGHRLFFSETQADTRQQSLTLRQRFEILDQLCAHFDSLTKPLIIVLDEADRDLTLMEGRVEDLIEDGHRVTLERGGVSLRAKRLESLHLSILASGNPLSIEGVEITSVTAYAEWKAASGLVR